MTATFGRKWGALPENRRRAAIVLGSLTLHAAILSLIGLGLFESGELEPAAPEDLVYLDITPRPLLEGETARVASPTRTRLPAETRPLTGPAASLDASRRLAEESDISSPPSPRTTGAPGPGTPAPPDSSPWANTPETTAAVVGRTLRTGTGGCRIMDGHLSAAEQALCDDRFNAGAAAAATRHPLGGRTRTALDEQRNEALERQAAANDAWRAYREKDGPYPGLRSMLTQH